MQPVEQVTQALSRYLAACESRNLEAIVGCFAEDAEIEDPTRRGIRGREAIGAYFSGLYDGLETLSLETGPLYHCYEKVACHWRGFAKRRGGSQFSYEGIDVLAFDGDLKIISMSAFWDPKDFVL